MITLYVTVISGSKTHAWWWSICWIVNDMMTSSNGNIFRVTGPLCRDFTGHRWIPRTKASDAELWCFSLICARINVWANNGDAGDLRRHLAHYVVIVMEKASCWWWLPATYWPLSEPAKQSNHLIANPMMWNRMCSCYPWNDGDHKPQSPCYIEFPWVLHMENHQYKSMYVSIYIYMYTYI